MPTGSVCPTFAAVAMKISNARWDGVPFLLKVGAPGLQGLGFGIRVRGPRCHWGRRGS